MLVLFKDEKNEMIHTNMWLNYVSASSLSSALLLIFTARCTIVQSAVLRLLVVRPYVRLSVCDVGESGPHRLEILETNCTDS